MATSTPIPSKDSIQGCSAPFPTCSIISAQSMRGHEIAIVSTRQEHIGRNLLDKDYVVSTASYTLAIAGRPGTPRTVEATFSVKW